MGWPRFSSCQPNVTHHIVRDLELVHNKVSCIVTQNVDSLHYKAGSKNVIELHGSAYRVLCLNCDARYSRFEIQQMLTELNPTVKNASDMIRPDGDVDIPQVFIQFIEEKFAFLLMCINKIVARYLCVLCFYLSDVSQLYNFFTQN